MTKFHALALCAALIGSPVAAEELRFSEAMELPGVGEKARALAVGYDSWLVRLLDEGGPESPGYEFVAGGDTYKYYFTCWPKMCVERSVGLMIGPQGDVYLQAYGEYAQYGGYVLGSDSPYIEEIMKAQRSR